MRQAVRLVAEWLPGRPGIHRVWAVCDIDSVGSARVLEKAGFVREGRLRRWMAHPNISPEPMDVHVLARVRSG